jgi:hypothetical protein
MHLTAYGYWRVAHAITQQLGIEPTSPWRVSVGPDGKATASDGVQLSRFERTPHGVRFDAVAQFLPPPPPQKRVTTTPDPSIGRTGEFGDLPPGRYLIRVDGEPSGEVTLTGPGAVQLSFGADRVEQLRLTIIDKNRLYFHRWRPQNETYLFGFRKHEQGQNAAEIPKFDPLVEELEKKIAELRVPRRHVYEIQRVHQ